MNNLSGPIPGFLGNITTLRNLCVRISPSALVSNRIEGPVVTLKRTMNFRSMESNSLSGTVPPEIGKLVNLERLSVLSFHPLYFCLYTTIFCCLCQLELDKPWISAASLVLTISVENCPSHLPTAVLC